MSEAIEPKASFFKGLLARGEGSCFVFDYDGTLAPIVIDPATAKVSDSLLEPLRDLSKRASIKIISGRPVDFLCEKLRNVFEKDATEIEVFGKYGIERGTLAEGVTEIYEVEADALSQLHRLQLALEPLMPKGCFIEEKGTSTGYHFRQNPSQLDYLRELILTNIERLHLGKLEVHGGKMVFEVMAADVPSKGSTISSFCHTFEGVFFAGDDLGDVDAFGVIASLPDQSGFTVLVRGSSETESIVGTVVDLIVEDQVQLAELIKKLIQP